MEKITNKNKYINVLQANKFDLVKENPEKIKVEEKESMYKCEEI